MFTSLHVDLCMVLIQAQADALSCRCSVLPLQIVDRPTQGHKFLSRQYVQPQWVFDSANFRVLAKAELYGVGQVPPPHLSPFVQSDEEGYVPDYLQTMLKLQVCSMTSQRILNSLAAITPCANRCLSWQFIALSATNTLQRGHCL